MPSRGCGLMPATSRLGSGTRRGPARGVRCPPVLRRAGLVSCPRRGAGSGGGCRDRGAGAARRAVVAGATHPGGPWSPPGAGGCCTAAAGAAPDPGVEFLASISGALRDVGRLQQRFAEHGLGLRRLRQESASGTGSSGCGVGSGGTRLWPWSIWSHFLEAELRVHPECLRRARVSKLWTEGVGLGLPVCPDQLDHPLLGDRLRGGRRLRRLVGHGLARAALARGTCPSRRAPHRCPAPVPRPAAALTEQLLGAAGGDQGQVDHALGTAFPAFEGGHRLRGERALPDDGLHDVGDAGDVGDAEEHERGALEESSGPGRRGRRR